MRIAIVGGGIAGASAAWALASDHEVVLIERETDLGSHATGRSAATLSETSGHRTVCAMARASRPFLEAPPDGFVEQPLTGPRGLLWIGRAGDESSLDAIADVAASGVAPTARRVDAAEAGAIVTVLRPEAVAAGGVWEPDARSVDVAALLASYISGARTNGADVRRGSEVRQLERTEHGWSLELATAEGTSLVSADVVIDAAGAWGDEVAARAGIAPIGLQPFRRTAAIVPLPAGLDESVSSWPLVMDVASRCYFEPESGGLLLSPADEHPSEPVDASAEMEDVAWALEVLGETTMLDIRHVRHSWAGLRTFAPDRVPVIGWEPSAPGFCWLVGQGGAGIKTAPAAAAAVAAIVGGTAWPEQLDALGVGAAELARRG